MANVLTNLASDIYKAADIVGRELVGLIPSVTINAGTQEVGIGQNVRSHFTRSVSTTTIAPSMTIPEGTDQTVDTKTLTLTKQKGVEIPWTGEDVKFVEGAGSGAGFETIYGDQIAQAMRAIANEIEVDICTDAYQNAGGAYGTSGTTPFGSNFDEVAELRKNLVDRGCPMDGQITLVVNTAAGVKLRNLAQLQKVNEAGGSDLLRQGELLDLQGIRLKESAGIQAHTAGTGASYDVDLVAGYSAGDKAIHIDTGSGTITAGDILTFSSDTSLKYVNSTLVTPGSGDEDITLNAGLLAAVADGEDMAIQSAYTANLCLHRRAYELAIRAPANPIGGDAAVDRMLVQDPHSGLVFEISVYKGFKKAMIMVGAVWGYKAWKPEFIQILQG